MDVSLALSAGVESAINHYLSLDPEAMHRFSELEGKIICIDVSGLNISLYLFPSSDGFLVLNEFDGEADATISGSPVSLAKLGMIKDARDVLFDGEVNISGDTRLANQFNRLLGMVNIDWEDILSRSVGDIVAHKVGNTVKNFGSWFKRATHSVCLDSGEYLQEEVKLSPSNAELRNYIKQVDDLRDATERLAARLLLLKNNQKK